MKNIIQNPDGTFTVTLDEVDLHAIGAAIWNAKEGVLNDVDHDSPCGLYSRFFPNNDAPESVTPEEFESRTWEIYAQLRDDLNVDMG